MSEETNPNNCKSCEHWPDPAGVGWCYMFRDEPREVCMQHTGRKIPGIRLVFDLARKHASSRLEPLRQAIDKGSKGRR